MSRKESSPYRERGWEEVETNPGDGSQAVRELLQLKDIQVNKTKTSVEDPSSFPRSRVLNKRYIMRDMPV